MVTIRLIRYSFDSCGSGRNDINIHLLHYLHLLKKSRRKRSRLNAIRVDFTGSGVRRSPGCVVRNGPFLFKIPTLYTLSPTTRLYNIEHPTFANRLIWHPERASEIICNPWRGLRCRLCINYPIFKSLNNHKHTQTYTNILILHLKI